VVFLVGIFLVGTIFPVMTGTAIFEVDAGGGANPLVDSVFGWEEMCSPNETLQGTEKTYPTQTGSLEDHQLKSDFCRGYVSF